MRQANPLLLLVASAHGAALAAHIALLDCGNGTLSTTTAGEPTCICHPGYVGARCEVDECEVLTLCSGHATCKAGVCKCDVGWMAPSCEVDTCPGHVPTGSALGCHASLGHGHCVGGVCQCNLGWMGEACEIDTCPKRWSSASL